MPPESPERPDREPSEHLGAGAKRRLLAVRGLVETPRQVEDLCRSFDIELVSSRAEAVELVKREAFDGVIAATSDFLLTEEPLTDHRAALVLDTIGEGACVVEADGTMSWMNRRMSMFNDQTLEHTTRICTQAKSIFDAAGDQGHRNKKFTFSENGSYFEIICSPVRTGGEVSQVVAVVWDASSGKRLQAKIDAIDAAGRELARIDRDSIAELRPQERLRLMQEKIINFSKELMHFDHFAIRVLDKKTNRLEVVISEGLPEEALSIDLYANPEGNGISGYVGATGRSYICHDVEKDGRYVLGLDHSKSSLTVPLNLFGEVVGTYNVESDRVGAFTEDDRQFAEIFGRYVAMALNVLDLLVVERFHTSSTITQTLLDEAAGPAGDIVCEIDKLREDYLGDPTLVAALERVKRHATTIRSAIDAASDGPNRVIGCDDDAASPPTPSTLLGKRILVADDEPNIRKSIRDVLEKRGCTVTVAKDGQEACGILDTAAPFDLVLSDIKMPYRNGYEIFATVQRQEARTPVILMTGFGYDPHHSIVRASQDGLAGVLFKPFKVEQLIEEVEKATSEASTV